MMAACWLILLIPLKTPAIDWNSYCQGWCRNRYQEGFYRAGKCGCVDFYQINLDQRFSAPNKLKEQGQPSIYYGLDRMHESSEDE